jgi:ABC-type branched-subunit amino acid transport system ATPase component
MPESALVVENLGVRYGGVTAVKDVSFVVSHGSCIGIVGANGAGKTSLLRGIGGLEPTTRGTKITFDGTLVGGTDASKRARLGLGHVLEHRHLFPQLTVRQNLELGARAVGGRADELNVKDVCEMFPILEPHLAKPASQLSGGQQQMVAIGRALMGRPTLLMLDEPTVGLAPRMVDDVIEAIRLITSRQVAVALVEQRLDIVQAVASEVHVLAHGVLRTTRMANDPELEQVVHDAYFS